MERGGGINKNILLLRDIIPGGRNEKDTDVVGIPNSDVGMS